MSRCRVLIHLCLVGACAPPPEADAPFNEALVDVYEAFDGTDADLARQLRNLESKAYQQLAVDSPDVYDRSVQAERLTVQDVAGLDQRPPPSVDPADAVSVVTGFGSTFPVEAHAVIPLLADQRVVEPQSPDHYNRQFLAGEDCWGDRGCDWLKTFQDLTKVYPLGGILPPITYEFFKDFRWIDLNEGLADADGERWAFLARSWNPDSYSSDDGRSTIYQSYTLEMWMPRDGGGFLWDDVKTKPEAYDPETWGDTGKGGTLRLLGLWTQTEVPIVGGDEAVLTSTIRIGMEDNFTAHDRWLAENRSD